MTPTNLYTLANVHGLLSIYVCNICIVVIVFFNVYSARTCSQRQAALDYILHKHQSSVLVHLSQDHF